MKVFGVLLLASLIVAAICVLALRVPRKLRRPLVAGSVIIGFMLAVLNGLVCTAFCVSTGGSTLLGGVDNDGAYYVRDHARIMKVSAETFRHLHQYEVFSGWLFDVAFWAFALMVIVFAIAQRWGFLSIDDPFSLAGALQVPEREKKSKP